MSHEKAAEFNVIARLRRALTVKHHIPGRIRVSFDESLLKHPETKRFMQMKHELPPGVKSVRVNPLACSVVMEYDTRSISPGLLDELMTVDDDVRAMEIAGKLKVAVERM